MSANKFDTHANLMKSNRVFVITHPKKSGHAEIIVKYPNDGAGRLRVSLRDCFGDTCEFSSGYAGGYGYDKLTAAISGLVIDGHKLTDNCGEDATSKKLLTAHKRAVKSGNAESIQAVARKCEKAGYQFANYADGAYQSCYKLSGLDYLRALGYRVITVG